MYCEWYGVCDFVVLSVVEVCADYGGVNVFHVCLNFGVVYGVGVCVNVYGVVCVVLCCLGVVILDLFVMRVVGCVPLWVVCVFRRVDVVCVVYPVAILSAVFGVICKFVDVLSDTIGDHYGGNVLEYGYCYGFVCCEERFLLFSPCC